MLWITSAAAVAFAVLWACSLARVRHLRGALIAKDKALCDAERAAKATADILGDEYLAHEQTREQLAKAQEQGAQEDGAAVRAAREIANILNYNGTDKGQEDVNG